MHEAPTGAVVTCFLQHRGDVLLLRRSDAVGTYRGRWGGVAGFAEGDPPAAAWREIEEETGLAAACTLACAGAPFAFEDRELGRRWRVHPFLFDCSQRDARLDWESSAAEWVAPTEILRRPTVPELWRSWRAVAPTLETVAADRLHGSAWLSLAALGALRDRAGELAVAAGGDRARAELQHLAHDLLGARPAMAALRNRVVRAWSRSAAEPATVEEAARRGIAEAWQADEQAARAAATEVAGRTVLTLSRSATVAEALRIAATAPAGHRRRLRTRWRGRGDRPPARRRRARRADRARRGDRLGTRALRGRPRALRRRPAARVGSGGQQGRLAPRRPGGGGSRPAVPGGRRRRQTERRRTLRARGDLRTQASPRPLPRRTGPRRCSSWSRRSWSPP